MNDQKKLENIVLFICNNSRGWMTEPRLALLMWRIDKAAFLMLARKITAMRYVRKQIGPAPVGLAPLLDSMKTEGSIRYLGNNRIQATRKTDRSCFPDDELMSVAHDLTWATYPDGEEIPFEAYLSRIENPTASAQKAIRDRIRDAEMEYEGELEKE